MLDMTRRQFFCTLAASAVVVGCTLPTGFPKDPKRWTRYYAADWIDKALFESGYYARDFESHDRLALQRRADIDGLTVDWSSFTKKLEWHCDRSAYLSIASADLGIPS